MSRYSMLVFNVIPFDKEFIYYMTEKSGFAISMKSLQENIPGIIKSITLQLIIVIKSIHLSKYKRRVKEKLPIRS